MFRHRIKDAVLAPIGNQMTLVSREFFSDGLFDGD